MIDSPSPAAADAPDSRPRPQYGEYATPEEQAARIRQPDATDALSAGQALESPAAAPRWGGTTAAQAAPRTTAQATPAPQGRWRLADRVLTVGLLAYGLVNIVFRVPTLFSFEGFGNEVFDLVGIADPFTNVAAGNLWGAIAATVLMVGWVLTAAWSWLRLRRGKISFWVPLVGATVTGIIVAVCVFVPITGDPAAAEMFGRLASGG